MMLEKVLVPIIVIALVLIVVRGLWRATAVQKGTGCPICDAHLGHDHNPDHDHSHGKDHGHDHDHGKEAGAASKVP